MGTSKTLKLAPSATGAAGKVAFKIQLPEPTTAIDLGGTADAPELYSGMGDNLDNWLVTKNAISVPDDVSTPALTFTAWYEIEDGYDYGFVEASTDGGTTWTALEGSNTVLTAAGCLP